MDRILYTHKYDFQRENKYYKTSRKVSTVDFMSFKWQKVMQSMYDMIRYSTSTIYPVDTISKFDRILHQILYSQIYE